MINQLGTYFIPSLVSATITACVPLSAVNNPYIHFIPSEDSTTTGTAIKSVFVFS